MLRIETVSEWKRLKGGEETSLCAQGQSLAVFFLSHPASVASQRVLELAESRAARVQGLVMCSMRVDECLDELAREGVRFSGQFPVLHVYKDGQKKHQVVGGDLKAYEQLLSSYEEGGEEARRGEDGLLPPRGSIGEVKTLGDFQQLLEQARDRVVVVDFTASWCQPCKRMKPTLERLAARHEEGVFVTVDVDENDETASFCHIESMPTFLLYKGGEQVGSVLGAREAELREAVARLFS
ncbi:hypothetical protein GUITHDRAFT_89951 [Guillardia theta CCMP2712]|uniref:Thioredoxin domain-containing protein n=3 Tax=Guillardia theta TaxID=55529 RepID=L1IL29_GUITC|nr:hypothetical protein GUITHDRAFT_89951 [Guillardia theta CCMP2712]EKX36505.1 hypothetical protein GUITHDRAFT_89951 [Guillardia theta CCMP2712]|eukprot:XP_005823485.1 hypothetical protein GUITHDRAFT_89951 [Guillardia theta CCMP2712]